MLASLASLKMEIRKGRVTGLSVALSNTAWYIRASMNTWPNRTLLKRSGPKSLLGQGVCGREGVEFVIRCPNSFRFFNTAVPFLQ